jgi:FkbM family methyltransferase
MPEQYMASLRGSTQVVRRLARRGAERAGVEREIERLGRALHGVRAGAKWRKNERDDEFSRLLAAALLRAGSNSVDVGANTGKLLETFVSLAPEGRHIAYEPIPELAARLAHRFPQADVRQAALTDRVGETSFVMHLELPSRSSIRSVGVPSDKTRVLTVPTTTLDDDLPSDFVPDLIKIDVEGAEYLVLRGARETLRQHKPVVLFELQVSTAAHYESGPEIIFDLLCEDLDFRIFDVRGGGPYSRESLTAVYEADAEFNFIATPSGER